MAKAKIFSQGINNGRNYGEKGEERMVNLKRLPIVLKPGNSGKNSGGTAHSGGIKKKKKGYSFRRIAFFPFWSKRPKCSLLFALITNSRPLLETESEKFTVVLQIGLESISFPFLIRKQLSVPFVGKHRNFPTNVKRSWYFILEREKEREIENVAALRQIRGAISPKQTNKSKKARGYGSKADAFPFFAHSAKPLRKGTSSAA